ncbi:MAG: DUF1850 domain-containing protein [Roseinatronobacter sp.]
MRIPKSAALVAALAFAQGVGAQELAVWDGQSLVASHILPVCLVWNHSVTGGLVADCFGARDGLLVLTHSYLHDFAAGLGEVAGRGTLRPDQRGGYWIDAINQPLPHGLTLRLGGPQVAHRLMPDPFAAYALPLPTTRRRITLAIIPDCPTPD